MTFEQLFKTVAANNGEISFSFKDSPYTQEGAVRRARFDVKLPRDNRISCEFVVCVRSAREQRDRGLIETMHLRQAIADVNAALQDQLHSPAKVLSRLAGRDDL